MIIDRRENWRRKKIVREKNVRVTKMAWTCNHSMNNLKGKRKSEYERNGGSECNEAANSSLMTIRNLPKGCQ